MTIVKGNVICPECLGQVSAKAGNREKERESHPADKKTESAGSRAAVQTPVHSSVHQQSKSKFLTFVLSFLPGLGHLYLGLTRQGIELMTLFFASTWMVAILGPFPFGFFIPILFFYGIFDALQKRDRLARGEDVDMEATFFRNINCRIGHLSHG
ncbi:hypothetical protein [Effusibacillus dendaii]|uniref:TM2 domain-containing protein n=1 Tax=Effusibacillus dendaii TaxID=2743772 RepID=A0A7I8D7K7_9BACL|nr:hypothetical protein [Effusibacillus dendaii]BCJ86084.1 hypothetical protein skT53_10690 [Effusibacillus dendaii]